MAWGGGGGGARFFLFLGGSCLKLYLELWLEHDPGLLEVKIGLSTSEMSARHVSSSDTRGE